MRNQAPSFNFVTKYFEGKEAKGFVFLFCLYDFSLAVLFGIQLTALAEFLRGIA